ncbi:DUF2490 domain-containing protein [Dyadobacter sp. MSC1_007]|jgi:hypothetical protein|uniref:DUF2490 domain-containing protein n=1 Tax=Dyadobacter sp. MSC1_007 TaxID=2909264 RepID=UPI00202F87BA|nr:DUF2490 domain-containing protein [Dyadobacter sp. MSC1_007]
MKKHALLLLLVNFTLPSFGQKQIDKYKGVWSGYMAQARLSDKWGLWFDLHARHVDFLDRWSTQIIRPGIIYYPNENLRVMAGYTYARNFPAPGLRTVRPENRIWQQVIWTTRQKRLQTQQGIRIEERFNRKVANDQLQDGYHFAFRFRYQITLRVPLNRDFIEANTVFLALSEEILVNAGKQITYNVFDQNRLFAGLGYQFTENLGVQAGYMNQFQQLSSGNRFNSNNVLRVSIFHTPDFRNKE